MSFFEELKRRNVVRVGVAYAIAAWVLLQVIDLVLEYVTAPDWVMHVFMLALGVGFPIVLVFAWIFEMTPEGVKRESEIDREQSITHHTGRKLDRAIIAFLVVAVLILLGDRFLRPPATSAPDTNREAATAPPQEFALEKSIAVLPFVNMSADPDNEYFSDGISEEILNVLARVPELKVAARTSAFAFKGKQENIAQIAEELNVDHVLEGSVRKAGNTVRVTAQLIQADDGYHLWSDSYDRELDNIFTIQDEIATAIADALKVTLEIGEGEENLTGTTSTEAYDAYLRGTNQWHLRTEEGLYNALDLFQQAIDADPEFARAWAGLALAYAVIMDYTEFPEEEARRKAGEAARRALELDPRSVEAATALIYSTDNLAEQLEYAERAIAMDASFATAHQWYGTSLGLVGDLAGAEREYRKGLELDPRSRVINSNLANQLRMQNRWKEAMRLSENILSWAPNYSGGAWIPFLYELIHGDRASAQAAGQRLADSIGAPASSYSIYIDLAFEPERRSSALDQILAATVENSAQPQPGWAMRHYEHLLLLAMLGFHDEARDILARMIHLTPVYYHGSFRVDRSIPEFVCHPDTRELFAETDLPPLRVPYPCEELLK